MTTAKFPSSGVVTAPADQPAQLAIESASVASEWVETALTVTFAAAAVLFVSFLAVVTRLV